MVSPFQAELGASGVEFRSDTDSEVIAQLAESYLGAAGPEAAVIKTLGRLQGTYGLAFVFRDFPDLVIGARNGSPLVVGVGDRFDTSCYDSIDNKTHVLNSGALGHRD